MAIEVEKIWSGACKLLADRLSGDVYDRWIGVIKARDLKKGVLILEVGNDFYHSWLEENYLPLIKDAVASVHEEPVQIVIEVNKDSVSDSRPTSEPGESAVRQVKPRPRRQVYKRATQLNPNYTFENFVVGPSNKFAHAACLAVAQMPGKSYNPLFVYGDSGLGKTHLMQAIGHHASQQGAKVCFVSCEEFVNQYIEGLSRKELPQFRNRYRTCDMLLIDDVQFLGGKEAFQEEFFHTFNALFDGHNQIVLTCDKPASEIPELEHRLVSRFEWGLVTQLQAPDVETRMAILKRKKEAMELHVDDDALTFIAENIRSNVRRLEGALVRAVSYASVTGTELTPEMLEELLRDTIDKENEAVKVTVEAIQKLVADYYDISVSDICSKRRPASIAFPRQMAMYLSRNLTPHSLPHIGQAFSKNHATVLHACRMIESKMQSDPAVRQTLAILRKRIMSRKSPRD